MHSESSLCNHVSVLFPTQEEQRCISWDLWPMTRCDNVSFVTCQSRAASLSRVFLNGASGTLNRPFWIHLFLSTSTYSMMQLCPRLGHQFQNASQYAKELKMVPNWAFVKLRSRSRSGEGQLQVRWGSGRLESGPSHVNQSYIYLFFLPPSTHPLETFFLVF